jgi:hypothetical protein
MRARPRDQAVRRRDDSTVLDPGRDRNKKGYFWVLPEKMDHGAAARRRR